MSDPASSGRVWTFQRPSPKCRSKVERGNGGDAFPAGPITVKTGHGDAGAPAMRVVPLPGTVPPMRAAADKIVPAKARQLRLGIVKVKKALGNGTVASGDGAITCGKDCSDTFYPGAPVTLTATPDPGAVFTGWAGIGVTCPGSEPCTALLKRNTTIRPFVEEAACEGSHYGGNLLRASFGVGRIV